jgi:hypothetical protein
MHSGPPFNGKSIITHKNYTHIRFLHVRVYYGVQKIQIPLEDPPSNLKYALIPLAAIASPPPNTHKKKCYLHITLLDIKCTKMMYKNH